MNTQNKLSIAISSLEDTEGLGQQLASAIENGTTVYLHGPLGIGKTTFVRAFLRGLGYSDKVKSPTYTLVEPYQIADKTVYHFDLYRLKSPEELLEFGIHDYFSQDAICVIEWPEKGSPILNEPDLTFTWSLPDGVRRVTLEGNTGQGKKILSRLGRA